MIQKVKDILECLKDPYPRIRGNCEMCGLCCRSLILTYRGKPVVAIDDFKKLLRKDYETYARFYPDEELEEGKPITFSCRHQERKKCSVHDSRPQICRTYPHRSIFRLGAELEDGCGYRVVNRGDFEDILDKKMNNGSPR